MLSFFKWGDLPGEDPRYPPPGVIPNTDVASFREIWAVAQSLELCCLTLRRSLGWGSIGRYRSIGIFIWSTSSEMNDHVPRGGRGLGPWMGADLAVNATFQWNSLFNISSAT